MKRLILDSVILTLITLVTSAGCILVYSAPAPTPRKSKQEPTTMNGKWDLVFDGHKYQVTLSDEYTYGGEYRAIGPGGTIWIGRWYRTKWDDIFMVHEKTTTDRTSNYVSFPLRYDGTPTLIVNGEDAGRGSDWCNWNYAGATVSIKRVK